MAHKVGEPTIFIPKIRPPEAIEDWESPSPEEIRRRRSFSVVVYAPKYDENLREEADITLTEDGKFQV